MIDREKQSGLTQELIIILEELEDAGLSSFDIINRGNRLKTSISLIRGSLIAIATVK